MDKNNQKNYYPINKGNCNKNRVENNCLLSSKIIDFINIENKMYKVVVEKFQLSASDACKKETSAKMKIDTYEIKYNEIGLCEKEKEELAGLDKLKFYSRCTADDPEELDLYNIYEARINTNGKAESGYCRIFEENKEFYISNYSFKLVLRKGKVVFNAYLVNNNVSGKIFENSYFDFYGRINLRNASKIIIREEYKTFLKVDNIEVIEISEAGILRVQVEYLFKVQKEIYVLKNDLLSVLSPVKK